MTTALPYLIEFWIFFQTMFSPVEAAISDEFIPVQRSMEVYQQLNCPSLNPMAFQLAFEGFLKLVTCEEISQDSIITIIDFSKPSTADRIFVINLNQKRIVIKTMVAHGKGSGLNYANTFSNVPSSLQSSLGFYLTGNTYYGRHGYSLRLKGIEPGINCNAWRRAIVIHGANYVSNQFIAKHGRLGRSFGCPALPTTENRKIIDLIKGNSCIFIYAPNQAYLQHSKLLSSSYYSQIIPE